MPTTLERIAMDVIHPDACFEVSDKDAGVYCAFMDRADICEFWSIHEGCTEIIGEDAVKDFILYASELMDLEVDEDEGKDIHWEAFGGTWIVRRNA